MSIVDTLSYPEIKCEIHAYYMPHLHASIRRLKAYYLGTWEKSGNSRKFCSSK